MELEEQQTKKMRSISLSNDTTRTQIIKISEDSLLPQKGAVRKSPVFLLQLDESIDVAACAQLLVYPRYYDG